MEQSDTLRTSSVVSEGLQITPPTPVYKQGTFIALSMLAGFGLGILLVSIIKAGK